MQRPMFELSIMKTDFGHSCEEKTEFSLSLLFSIENHIVKFLLDLKENAARNEGGTVVSQ